MPTLHVHLDESGNLTFKPSGSRYYVFTAAWTYDPAPLGGALTALRFALLKQGHDLHRFHATEDKQVNRDAVVAALARHETWRFAAVVIEKAKVYPDLRVPHRFYPEFASSVLKHVFRRHLVPGTDTVLVFTGTLRILALPLVHILIIFLHLSRPSVLSCASGMVVLRQKREDPDRAPA